VRLGEGVIKKHGNARLAPDSCLNGGSPGRSAEKQGRVAGDMPTLLSSSQGWLALGFY
jgi:hypothetical protein